MQTIKGVVLDRQTLEPMPAATVILLGSDPVRGVSTDENGRFRLDKVPIGTHRIKVTYVGYKEALSGELIVGSGKETTVTMLMEEVILNAGEVEIRGENRKYEPINKMATVSVRGFTIDETFRFPGSYNDPARMAANFAGVTSGIDNRNDLIVRGNSPTGLQWRIDGIEVPNPNHFAAVGTTGGPVTVLNSNLLANSDFFTGVFPAEYGNALAGVFDIRLKTGNAENYEYWGEIGWNGVEFGAEGPLDRKNGGSFIAAYRFSLLQLLGYTGIDLGVIPQYQDLNFRVSLPTRKAGTFQLTGLGGLSYIELNDSEKAPEDWTFPGYGENLSNGSNLGVLGISHQIYPSKDLLWRSRLSWVGSKVYTRIDTFTSISPTPAPYAGERSTENRLTAMTGFTRKFSARNTLEAEVSWDLFLMSFADSAMYHSKFVHHTGSNESMQLWRGYLQWKHRFSDRFFLTAGIAASWLTLNQAISADPRVGASWSPGKRITLTLGAGLYSQMQPRVVYFILSPLPDGTTWQPNLMLDNNRSAQVAAGFSQLLNENLQFRVECYYQYLFSIPVKTSIPQYFLLNQGHEFFLDRQYSDSLINLGTGQNYGAEFTFERFFRKHYYFLLTASLFNSEYSGTEKVMRNSAFNVNYALNAAGGYEFVIGKRKWGVMSFGLRATWAGGNPYIPFDVEGTVASGETVYDWQAAYDPRYPEYRRASFRFGIKRNLPGYHIEFLLDLQYRTSYTNIYLQRINPQTGEIKTYFNLGFFPMGTWRIQF